jgi:replicative DNA helicase
MQRRNFLKSLAGTALLAGSEVQAQARLAPTESPTYLSVCMKTTEAIPTGFPDFDRMQGGLWRGDLVVIGARPCMGKSTIAQTIAEHVSLNLALPTLVFSLEMSGSQYVSRTLAALSGLRPYDLWPRNFDQETFDGMGDALVRINASPLLIVDDTFEVEDMGGHAEAARQKFGPIGLIVVDYFQLLGSRTDDEGERDAEKIIRTLKQLALDANAPVLVLSQLGRALEKRRNKRPTLRDFRERTIAKHADMVIFLYRDEVYDPDSEDRDSMEMLIQKNRHGPLGMAQLSFNNQILRWQPFPDEGTKSMARCREMLSIEYAVKS